MIRSEDAGHENAPGTSRRTVAVVSLVAMLVLLALATARPAWRLLKNLRASHFVTQARSHMAAGDLAPALDRARAAMQLAPGRAEVIRLNAELATSLGSRNCLSFWSQLVDMGAATREDLILYAEAGLRMDRADLVREIASNLVAGEIASPRGERVAALYFAEARRFFEALHHARNAFGSEPGNPTNEVLLADLLLTEATPDNVAEARQHYRNAARSNPTLRLHAARRLGAPPLGERTDREGVVELLSSVTNREAAEDILLLETKISLDPSSSGPAISNIIAHLPRNDLPRLAAVADTLRRLGRHEEILRLTAGGREFRGPELFRARLEALLATGRTEDAYRLSLARDVPLPPFELELTRVRTARLTGDSRRRDSHLRELIRAAGVHPTRLRSACEIAEEMGALDIAADGWRILSQQPADAVEALRQLQRLADLRGDTWTARDFAQRAVRAGGTDPLLHLEIARYDLLLGEELERATGEARRQVEERPSDFEARAILALAHLRAGSPERARAVLDRQVVDPSRIHPGALAILAAALGENGQVRKAEKIARGLHLARLRPEERELVRRWLAPPSLSGATSDDGTP